MFLMLCFLDVCGYDGYGYGYGYGYGCDGGFLLVIVVCFVMFVRIFSMWCLE